MRAFVISLADAAERQRFMAGQLERLGIEYEFLDAIRGSERIGDPASYDPAGAIRREGRALSAGEVGCALSHQAAYAEIASRGLPMALVLEDDATLHDDLPEVLRRLEAGAAEPGDLVLLERCDYARIGSGRPLFGPYRLAEPILVKAGACAQAAGYVVTAEAARALARANTPVTFPADSWGHYRRLARVRGVQPSLRLVRQYSDFGSSTSKGRRKPLTARYGLVSLLAHLFLTYTALGRAIDRPLRALARR